MSTDEDTDMESGEVNHELDPYGDTILVLCNANAPFAVWDDPERMSMAASQYEKADFPASPASQDGTTDPPEPPHIRFRLSSRHLILASRYFEKLMEGPWDDPATSTGPEPLHIVHAYDWDEQALLMLMNIIHGRSREVPRQLDLETMAKLAVLVDYYQCFEITDIYAETWLRHLPEIEDAYNRDLMLRFAVSWVFPEKKALKQLAQGIVRQCTGPIKTLDLPIPKSVVDELDSFRQDILKQLMDQIYILINSLSSPDGWTGCGEACDLMLLGSLSKALHAKGLLLTPWKAPYLGYSWRDMGYFFIDVPPRPDWHRHLEPKTGVYRGTKDVATGHSCTVGNLLKHKFQELGAALSEFDLTGAREKLACEGHAVRWFDP